MSGPTFGGTVYDQKTRQPRALSATARIVGVAMLGVILTHCVTSNDPRDAIDVESWELRDILAVEGATDGLTAQERATLRGRIEVAAAQEQTAGEERVLSALFEARAHDPYYPLDPLGQIVRLDEARRLEGQDVRPMAVLGQDADGVFSRPCAFDVEATPERGAWPEGWSQEGWSEGELEALTPLASALAEWSDRCAAELELDEVLLPEGARVVQREAQAPYLLAYWPQRRKLYVNPALLALVEVEPAPTGAEPLRTARQGLATSSVEACVAEVTSLCGMCGTQSEALANPSVCQNFFPESTIFSDCATLQNDVPNGVEVFCVYQVYQVRPSVETCVQSAAGTACDRGSVPVKSVSTLVQTYDKFLSSSTGGVCRESANSCANGTSMTGSNNGSNNGGGNNGMPEPEPTPDELEEPGFADDCFVCQTLESCGQSNDDAQQKDDEGCCGG